MESDMQGSQSKLAPNGSKGQSAWWWIILVVVVVVIGGIFVYQGSQDDFGFAPGGILSANLGDPDEIVIDEITIPEGGGFVVVYENTDSGRTRIGQSRFLPAGTHRNVKVQLDQGVIRRYRSGSSKPALIAVAHKDTNADGAFDSAEDEPFVDEDGEEISAEVVLDLGGGEGPPDSDDSGDVSSGDDAEESGDDSGTPPTGDDAGEAGDNTTEDTPTSTPTSTPAEAEEPVVVTLTDAGFSPASVTVALGDTVRFVSEGGIDMWVASAVHPTHAVYDGTDLSAHCPDTEGMAFDQCESGAEYSFTFSKSGSWGYHNHVNPSAGGTIVVE